MSTPSVAVILICGFTSVLRAQAPPAPPKPGPEHKKLEYFVGKWTVESEIKANKYMPAGKSVSTETCTLGRGDSIPRALLKGKYRRASPSSPTTAMRRPTHPITPAVSDSSVSAQEPLKEIPGRGWWKISTRAKRSKEERQSPFYRPPSIQASMKWTTERAVTQPS